MPKAPPIHELVIAGFGGLSLYSDSELRTKETWQQLDNFDLVVDGAIRKILPATLLSGPFTNVLYQLLEYRTRINYLGGFLRDVAVDALGNLWDINGSTSVPWSTSLVATLSPGITDIPFLGQMQGYYIPFAVKTWLTGKTYSLNDAVYRYSATDGNLYVFYVSAIAGTGTSGATEPKWPATQGSTVIDNSGMNQITWKNAGILNSQRFKLNYGILVARAYPACKFVEWKYDPTNAGESYKITGNRIGVSQPLTPFNVTASLITPNTNGYSPSTGRAYVWTYYNPNTLHDSSPSPFVGPTKFTNLDSSGAQTQLKGSVLQPLPEVIISGNKQQQFQSYQSVYLEIPVSALTPTYGDGYTAIRCWATLDGGASFFLLTQLYDDQGNLISNGDGSIPVATLTALQVARSWTGYVPLPTPQNAVNTVRIFDGGSTVVNLAPDALNLGAASWTETTGTSLSVVPSTSPAGQATFQYTGTGAGASQNIYKSTQIAVAAGSTYAFQGYIDNTFGVGGTVKWDIFNPATSGVVASFTQADNTAGNVSGTFTAPASGKVQIRAFINNTTVTTGALTIWGDPYLELGSTITTSITYPTPDTSLVLPAPAANSQNPPPANCLMGAIFDNALFLADYNDPSRLWYSNTGDFNSYGINSFIQFPSDRSFSIVELIAAYDRLLVSSGRSIDQVLSNSPNSGYARFPFDPQHGSLSYRGSIPYGSGVISLMDPGLALLRLNAKVAGANLQIGFTPEAIISRPIKPLLDAIDPATIHLDADIPGEPIPVVDNKQDLYLLGYRANPVSAFMDTLVTMPLRGADTGQFSRVTALPGSGQIVSLKEIQLTSNRTYGVMALTGDRKVYQLFGGTQDGTITSTAVTQSLPTVNDAPPEEWGTEKEFRDLIVEGNDLSNFQITASTDGGNTFPYPSGSPGYWQLPAGQHTIKLGVKGRQINLKFVHSAATANTPDLSFLKITWVPVGEMP